MNVARQVLSQLTEKPSVFTQGGKNLYQVLSVLPEYGVGSRVASTKVLNNPGLKDSYYEVTKVNLKPGLNHGRVWGVHVLKGRTMENGKPVEIRGGLKYNWKLLA
ncbi:hypothetical protein O0I10_000197 [Lichtheimia ornata]|uniref:Uncharacterized protein n=1 Tax=Lichtheimia ornata TaxID=688661 RepID=A0AAD7Y4Z3_9FUNG|nr:uncharacterized protein O0I10_000197 [Lichtheimia ornata]KAJ8663922.1 hypothetical protein O0I10_000197 [Lichtheimia ornata]